jgi:cyclic-di-AMP phosphodiesterase PgpH
MKKRLIAFLKTIPNIAKYIVALFAVLALGVLFPTNAKFKYVFSENQVWTYDDLYAASEFAIQKTQKELNEERALIEKDFSPFYEIDLDVISERKRTFQTMFEEQLKMVRRDAQFSDILRNSAKYQDYGNFLIDKLLKKGILKQDTFTQNKDKDFVLNILRGSTAEKLTLQNVLTPNKVKEFLNDSLVNRFKEPEFLYPLLEAALTPNLAINQKKSEQIRQEQLDNISIARGKVEKNQLIVAKNGIITHDVYQKLLSYKERYESDNTSTKKHYLVLTGYYLLTCTILLLFILYLRHHLAEVFLKLRWTLFLISWVLIYAFLTYGIKVTEVLHVYMIPFCIAPIVIRSFYTRELAIVTHTVIILIVGLIHAPGNEFILLQFLTGFAAIFSRTETRYWGNFFKHISFITLIYAISYLSLSLIEESNIEQINWSVFIWLSLNGFLTLLAYPLIPLFGNFFGFDSEIALAELSDLNHPLLKSMSLNAPGTLQHSLQVANLAEAAATAIGGNALLVKVGALYHDVGKLLKPTYFIENQAEENLHKYLTPLESAHIILEHISEGVKLAKKNGLPEVVIQFIQTHHGTTLVEFFYAKHLEATNQAGIQDKSKFQYAGPLPHTKEQTILMLADSLEAAAKSLREKTAANLDELTERIIARKIEQGQLANSRLVFHELEICKSVFKNILKSIYHVRVEYPK